MRDEQANSYKCQGHVALSAITDNVLYFGAFQSRVLAAAARQNQIEDHKRYLEFQSYQLRIEAMFSRINPTC